CAYRSAPATSSSTRSGPSNGRRPPSPPGRSPRATPTSASRSGSPRATRTTTSWGTRRNSSSPTPSTSTNGTWSSCGCVTRPAVPASRTTAWTPRTRTCRRSRSELSPDEGRALGGPPTAGTTNRVRTRPSELLGRAVGERKGRRPVGPYRASEIRVAELRAQRLESGHLVLAEASDVVAVLLGGEERRRPGLGVELVRVHHQPLLHRLRQVVGGRQRQPLLQDVVPGESHSGVVGAEPAQGLGEFLPLEDLVSQQAVPDVVAVVEPSVGPVEAVDPDVVEETAGADQLGVHMGKTGIGEQLLGDTPDDLAVPVDEVERLGRRCVPLVQGADLVWSRNAHPGSVTTGADVSGPRAVSRDRVMSRGTGTRRPGGPFDGVTGTSPGDGRAPPSGWRTSPGDGRAPPSATDTHSPHTTGAHRWVCTSTAIPTARRPGATRPTASW